MIVTMSAFGIRRSEYEARHAAVETQDGFEHRVEVGVGPRLHAVQPTVDLG